MKKFNTLLSLILAPAALTAIMVPGCATSPQTQEAKENLSDEAHLAYKQMLRADPSLEGTVNENYAHAIFPSVGKGAVGVGGSYGRGEVYKGDKFIGYADVSQGSVGVSLGGQTFAELIIFKDEKALSTFTDNKFTFSADASAVALKEGAAKTAKFTNGVAVVTQPKGGLMFDASIGGQQFTFKSADMQNQ